MEGLEGQAEALRHGLDQLLVAGIAGADEQPPLGHEDGLELLELGDAGTQTASPARFRAAPVMTPSLVSKLR